MRNYFSWMSRKEQFQESTPGEEVAKTVEITTFGRLRILHKLS